jgi:hypothetical protein
VLTYREMMERTADVLGRRRPRVIRVPVLTPPPSSYWVALVRQPPPGFDEAVRAATG